MKNAPPESVTVNGWTAYAAIEALRRRVRLLEVKREETTIAADEEIELRLTKKALSEIVDCLSPAPFPASPEPAETTPQTEQEATECPFSRQELWDALRVALPDVLYLEPGFPRDDYSFLPLGYLRQDCSRLKKLADDAQAASEERERAARKYRCLRKFLPARAQATLREISCALSA